MSARSFLVRGLLAGLVAGLAAFVVAFVFGEPSVHAAIALESSANDAADHAEAAVVPRSLQSTVGLLTGTVVLGVTLGGLLGVLSALALGRLGNAGPRGSTLTVAAATFVVVSLVPYLVQPPNPPGVGSAETIGQRSASYFLVLLISLLAAVAGLLVRQVTQARLGGWYAGLAAVGTYLLLVLAAVSVLPGHDDVPAGYPAGLLYEFRMASLLTSLTLWAVLAVVLADLVHRLVARNGARQRETRVG